MLYTEIGDNYTFNKKLMHFVARTCVDTSSAASSDVFAVLYLVPPKNGLEPLKKFEPLNGVIFMPSTKKMLNIA